MTRDKLVLYTNEITTQAIADIEAHWLTIAKSDAAKNDPEKFDWRHSVRYVVAKAAFEAATKLALHPEAEK